MRRAQVCLKSRAWKMLWGAKPYLYLFNGGWVPFACRLGHHQNDFKAFILRFFLKLHCAALTYCIQFCDIHFSFTMWSALGKKTSSSKEFIKYHGLG